MVQGCVTWLTRGRRRVHPWGNWRRAAQGGPRGREHQGAGQQVCGPLPACRGGPDHRGQGGACGGGRGWARSTRGPNSEAGRWASQATATTAVPQQRTRCARNRDCPWQRWERPRKNARKREDSSAHVATLTFAQCNARWPSREQRQVPQTGLLGGTLTRWGKGTVIPGQTWRRASRGTPRRAGTGCAGPATPPRPGAHPADPGGQWTWRTLPGCRRRGHEGRPTGQTSGGTKRWRVVEESSNGARMMRQMACGHMRATVATVLGELLIQAMSSRCTSLAVGTLLMQAYHPST
jgi:hypothetical protein